MSKFKPSRVKHPVTFTRSYLDRNPGLSRADAVKQLVRRGVNRATARTQVQRWHTMGAVEGETHVRQRKQ